MALPIEDYGLIGDTQTGALVGSDGSIDWLCLRRFDSGACFAALLGDERHGRVPMRLELVLRFDYGRVIPWVRRLGNGIRAAAGPNAVELVAGVRTRGLTTRADFAVAAGDEGPFVLTWFASHRPAPAATDPLRAVADTTEWWRAWSGREQARTAWPEQVQRSLITLKAMTYAPMGGIVAALTTSLPEQLGGPRNWDYRFCRLRDATLTLLALIEVGYLDEARAWRDWLLRAAVGWPSDMQIMYGPAGERRLTEVELDWLPGYEGSRPVRIGNAASRQFQLDVYGELMDALLQARVARLEPDAAAWGLQRALLDFLEGAWREPDEGVWEVRGPRRHFVHSKVLAWVAFDRAVRTVEHTGLEGPVDRWRRLREEIHAEVCERGWDAERATFTQSYGSRALDASLLVLPAVGFLPPDDERVAGTVEAVQRELCEDGFVLRYDTAEADDGLPPGEGAFLPCTFWLVDALALLGRRAEATALFERLLGLTNDLGLLAEEYDTRAGRLVGNFPQAFSHLGLVGSALSLSREAPPGPAEERAEVAS